LPATGGTLTRQCEVSDGPNESTYTTLEETIEVAPSRALVDRAIAPGVIQEAACKLVSLRNAQTNLFEFAGSDGLTHSFTPTISRPCKYLRPLFSTDIPSGTLCGATGPAPAGPYPGKASVDSNSPCLDLCSIDVSVTQNSEQLSAVFLEDGDRKGLIRLAAKEGWGPGSVATLTVSCGDSTITATITG
jgi:hypothetical protein